MKAEEQKKEENKSGSAAAAAVNNRASVLLSEIVICRSQIKRFIRISLNITLTCYAYKTEHNHDFSFFNSSLSTRQDSLKKY